MSDQLQTPEEIDRLAKIARRANQIAGPGLRVADDHPWEKASEKAKEGWRDTVRAILRAVTPRVRNNDSTE